MGNCKPASSFHGSLSYLSASSAMVITIADTNDALLVSKDGEKQMLFIKKTKSLANGGQVELSMIGA